MAGKSPPEGENTPLVAGLSRLAQDPGERWHTPGHKGLWAAVGPLADWPWQYDLTEVGDVRAWVRASEDRLAAQVGARRSWYSVQGATLAVMAGALAASPPRGRVALERHAHRSVLQAIILGDLEPVWVTSSSGAEGRVALPAREDDLRAALADADVLVLTRPTYDGVALSDDSVRRLTADAHRLGKTVVVDEAHGAHWGGRRGFPLPALDLGADLVAQGVHKTEPALTQTGVLHLSAASSVSEGSVEAWWNLLVTSSPSYLLLASLDQWQATRITAGRDRGWGALAAELRAYWPRLANRGFTVLQGVVEDEEGFRADPAKLTLIGPGTDWARALRPWGTVEKADSASVTFLLAPGQSLERLDEAITRLTPAPGGPGLPRPAVRAALRPRAAFESPTEWVRLSRSRGRVATRELTPYPPGIPWLVPGELVSAETVDAAREAIRADPTVWAGASWVDGELVVGVMRE